MLNAIEYIIQSVFQRANQAHHQYITIEHLTYGVLSAPEVFEFARLQGLDLRALQYHLQEYIEQNTPKQLEIARTQTVKSSQPTLGMKRVIERAVSEAQKQSQKNIDALDLLVALFFETRSEAFRLLTEAGFSVAQVIIHRQQRLNVVAKLPSQKLSVFAQSANADHTNGANDSNDANQSNHSNNSNNSNNSAAEGFAQSSGMEQFFTSFLSQQGFLASNSNLPESKKDQLGQIPNTQNPQHQHPNLQPQHAPTPAGSEDEQFLINLNEQVIKGRIDPLIGRSEEVERVVQILCRRRKNNPLLVGEAGVGKTAIAEGLAYQIVHQKVPDVLKDAVVYSVDMCQLLAGTRYRGDFEQRIKNMVQKIKAMPNAVLFIDEIHNLIGAGASSGNSIDAGNLLKPVLSSGELRCMGATTYSEYRKLFEKEAALARRFQAVEVAEPTRDQTVEILLGLRSRLEEHHHVHYSKEIIELATDLSIKYIHDRFLPDKALDILDEAGSYLQLKGKKTQQRVQGKHIEAVVAKIARVPEQSISCDERQKLKALGDDMKAKIFGQDEAIIALADRIKIAKAGLGNEEKPIGSFLFAGPTGVGKTEVAKQLANQLGIDFVRFDMSEYMERHAVSRLIGSPPGYVGYEEGGLLTEAINKKPHCVLLLDEIEKAHPDIFNLLLQVMDHGTLTDNNGRKANFKNVILIMTSNVGAFDQQKHVLGFTTQKNESENQELKRLFTPEFRNRLNAVIQFKALSSEIIVHVVDKFLGQLAAQLATKKVNISFSDELKQYLVVHGHDPLMGARPMERLIQNTLRKALSDELLFGRLVDGGDVHVDVDEKDEIQLIFEKVASEGKKSKKVKGQENSRHYEDECV